MLRHALFACLLAGAAAGALVSSGDGYEVTCRAEPQPDPETGVVGEPCGYTALVVFGGGMLFDSLTGYCRTCKAFVALSWTREDLPPRMAEDMGLEVKPRPRPLGEIWDTATGRTTVIHACPTCKGPFMEIKRAADLKHCPVCNQPHFTVDPSRPDLIID